MNQLLQLRASMMFISFCLSVCWILEWSMCLLNTVFFSLKVVLCGSYHFAGTKGVFYAREPYSNVDAVHVTRFFGLAMVGNKDKQVEYAFSARLINTFLPF